MNNGMEVDGLSFRPRLHKIVSTSSPMVSEGDVSGLARKLLVAVEPKRHDLGDASFLHRHTVEDIRCQHGLTVVGHDQEL
jgi:hypothetical protein